MIRCPETSVKDNCSKLRNVPEECRSHQYGGGSLKSIWRRKPEINMEAEA
jgi:hypothetical protein